MGEELLIIVPYALAGVGLVLGLGEVGTDIIDKINYRLHMKDWEEFGKKEIPHQPMQKYSSNF